MLCQQKRISYRTSVAHQNNVSKKKTVCGNKKDCVTPKKTHVD